MNFFKKMKISLILTNKISNAFIIIILLKICLIACEEYMIETEFENTLINLLKNMKKKRIDNLHNSKKNEFIDIKIDNVYDINEFSNNIKKINLETENSKKDYYHFLEKKSNLIQGKNKIIQSSIIKLKDKFDNIIENSNNINNNLNEKKTSELQTSSDINSKQMELDNLNKNNLLKTQNLKSKIENSTEKHLSSYRNNLSSLKNSMELRKTAKEEMINTQLKEKKADLEFKELEKLDIEQQGDLKLFKIISKNLSEESKNFNLNSLNSIAKIDNYKKILNDYSGSKKLEFEKDQQNEYNKEYNKKIKDLLRENEGIQNEIKELDKKKNRLGLKLKKKEIEIALKSSEDKNEIKNLKKKIQLLQLKILNNIKKQKTVRKFFFI